MKFGKGGKIFGSRGGKSRVSGLSLGSLEPKLYLELGMGADKPELYSTTITTFKRFQNSFKYYSFTTSKSGQVML